jgi:hypothetical protein
MDYGMSGFKSLPESGQRPVTNEMPSLIPDRS